MSKITFRTVLVVGENPEELIKKYDLGTKVEPYVRLRRSDAKKSQKNHLKFIENVLTSDKVALTDKQKEVYKELYLDIKEMTEEEYFEEYTKGCTYDSETGDALTTENPNAFYQYPSNPQKRLDATNEESDFANPFILIPLEGEEGEEIISYTAKKGDIDWNRMHRYNIELYRRAWEICVEGDTPRNSQEEVIKNNMGSRLDYFNNFNSVEEYINHSCSFWCYGYLDKKGYKELDYTISDKDWVANFYDRFVKPLNNNETVSLWVVRAID